MIAAILNKISKGKILIIVSLMYLTIAAFNVIFKFTELMYIQFGFVGTLAALLGYIRLRNATTYTKFISWLVVYIILTVAMYISLGVLIYNPCNLTTSVFITLLIVELVYTGVSLNKAVKSCP